MIDWVRALIRSGFFVIRKNEQFELREENTENRRFLKSVLTIMGLEQYFDGIFFYPPGANVKENVWLSAIERTRKNVEGGYADDLSIMDPYLAGIIRYVNILGIATWNSCDGHGIKAPWIQVNNAEDSARLVYFLNLYSVDRQWNPKAKSIVTCSPLCGQRHFVGDPRYPLLDIAEKLYLYIQAKQSGR